MDAVRTVLTYEDYASLPNDGRRYEIRDGELSVTPTPTFRHPRIVTALQARSRRPPTTRSP